MAHLAAALHVELSLTLILCYLICSIAYSLNWGLIEVGNQWEYVLASYGPFNKLPQTKCFKTIETYSHTVLETRSLKLRGWPRSCSLRRLYRKNTSLPLLVFGGCGSLWCWLIGESFYFASIFTCLSLLWVFIFTWYSLLYVSVSRFSS